MIRRVSMVLALASLVGWLAAGPSAGTPALLAQDEPDATQEPVAPPTAELDLGQRFTVEGWSLEVQDVFIEESADRFGYDEVRLSVAYQTLGAPLPYVFNALAGVEGFPALQLRDSAGEIWAIPNRNPGANLYPGSAQHTIESGIPASWTIGFDVPQSASDEMVVEAVWRDNVVAAWDLSSSPADLAGWDIPPGATDVLFGDTISWSDDVDITPFGHLTVECGNPEIERVTTVYAFILTAENLANRDAYFPDIRYPDVGGTAVWADGSSARYVATVQFFESEADAAATMPVNALNAEQLIVPPRTSVELAMLFALPRDSRLVDPLELPQALLLNRLGGEPSWIGLEDQPQTDAPNSLCIGISGTGQFQIGIPEGALPVAPVDGGDGDV